MLLRYGMPDSSPTPPVDAAGLAVAYDAEGDPIAATDLKYENPAGGAFSTAADMAEFLKFLVGGDRTSGRNTTTRGAGGVLDHTSLREWRNTVVQTDPVPMSNQSVMSKFWGVPWETAMVDIRGSPPHDGLDTDFQVFKLITKDGSVPGYNSQLLFEPESRLGVFAAMSTGTRGREVPFVSDVILATAFNVVPALVAILKASLPPISDLPPNPDDFIGSYSAPAGAGGSDVVVRIDKSPSGLGLQLINPGANPTPIDLRFVGDSKLQMQPNAAQGCWSRDDGDLYVVAFAPPASGNAAAGAQRGSFILEGFDPYGLRWTRV